ncbi:MULTISPECIES: hypothetical protein [unclassified Chryseobacterium]|uniref:hypothetical protein n=1 Tax=unclassified Chryseobacterium TaxID=2593645 RepID=UPI002269CA47|nr:MULTISPECIES: hypothetical protein [unclassified Chryseobacterium]
MKKINFTIIFLLLLILSSCKTRKIIGSWEFIEVYQGVTITKVDSLKSKKNTSVKGEGILIFNDDSTFNSMDSKGKYRRKGMILKMKYPELKDTTSLKISYIDKNYLLLSAIKNEPMTWFYKKVKKE